MKSYLSPKVKIKKSEIHGKGLFAIKNIKKDEIVGVKSGDVFRKKDLIKFGSFASDFGGNLLQIDDNFFVGGTKKKDIEKSMMYINHSCDPNIYIKNGIITTSLRKIKKGEEINIDYATIWSVKYKMKCNCGFKKCRKIIDTYTDWKNKEIQKKYKGKFAGYLEEKIKQRDKN